MKHNLLKSVIISVILLMGVSNAWAYENFNEIWGTYNIGGNDEGAAFSSNKDLGVVSKFTIQAFYLKCKDNWGASKTCWTGGALYYEVNGGGFTEVINTATDWKPDGWTEAEYQFKKENMNLTLATNSGKYTVKFYGKVWGNKDTYLSNNGNNYKWTFTINPPDITNIQVNATGCIGGTGTQQDPYTVAYGASLNLTASVTNSDANSNTHFTFGSNAASTTKTHTISNITNATAQKITIKAQNINKSDKSLKGTALSKDIYYKYTPVYVYINGQNHQINNTTKQVTVALTKNNGDETYTFKIHDDSSHWLGNNGTMERGGTAVHNGGWTMSANDGDCKLKADLTGDYTFTFMPATNKVTVTDPQKSYFIAGSWDNWAGTAPAFVDASTPVSIHLTGDKVYNFKIANLTETASWYGNNGEMKRTDCTAWTMETAKNDCRIYADLSGNYTFTFDKSTKKLTVTYPTAYKMTFGIDNAAHGTLKVQINYEDAESGKYWYPGTKFVFSYEINKGYLFKGWNTKQNGTGEWLSTNPTYTHTLTEDATVYAIFEDGYHITVEGTKYYFIDHNGKQINKLYIELGANTPYTSPLYKGATKKDDGTGEYTSTVAGTYTCELNDATPPTGVNWTPPYADGDYRLLYIEQEVGLEDGHPKTEITYSHPSDVIRKSNIASSTVVSLHIFNKMDGSMDAGGNIKRGLNNPEIILQQYNASTETWEDRACHMIFGPLRAGFMHAGMPGRKNASPNSSIDDLLYDNGIEVIKNDPTDNGSGVWDFTVYQDGTTATLDLTDRGLERYRGKYYIRTSAAKGQWSNYTIAENEMTESKYASDHFRLNNPYHEENEYFTHYFCEYVNKAITSNVKFIIANEHGMAISKEFTEDDFTDEDGNLAGANTNVRWSWNQITNKCKRAYIAGSLDGANEFLVVKNQDASVEIQNDSKGRTGYFKDNTNWLYYADVNSKPLAKVQVVAKYNNKYQYFMGAKSGENQYEQLIGGTASNTKYPVRIIYDFKEHRFVVAYLPPNTITDDVAIETSVMLVRTNHGETNQIVLNDAKKITAPEPAYGAITFTEQHLTGSGSQYEKMLYWVSFPFDVALPDVFGLDAYGTDWIMEYYDGEARSITGLTTYNTFWKYITDETTTLQAGVGYVLCLNVNKVNEYFLDSDNPNEEITLYFPSKESISWGDITKQGEKTISLTETKNSVSSETDHNWHLIGVPSYANTGERANTDNTDFLYQYDATDNTYAPHSSNGFTFLALHAYMVQHAGNITWTTYIAPSPIAARNNTDAVTHTLRLELQDNGSYADQTFIKLTDEENPTLDFDMNRDLPKIINTGANVYSLIQERNIQLAGNVMPVANTTIPLGVKITAAGEYTFAMPDGTDGIVVELIDYEANTTTNLLFNDYTVSLPKGTFENRFALSVKPDKTATSVENIFDNAKGDETSVRKFIIDGVLYMQKDGVLYDAQGHIVR